MNNGHNKSVPEVITDLKQELQEFVSTRVAILRAEMKENLQSVKMAIPVIVIGLGLLATAWLVLTGFLISIIAQAFTPNPWAYVVAFIIVAVAYALVGGLALLSGWKQLKQKGLKPERTIRVLQQDRIWIQQEGRAQL